MEAEPHFIGMRRAAVRRTSFELGINDLGIEDLHVVSRILYYAESCDKFAEHELDYIIFARKDVDPTFTFNPDEIESVVWVSYHDFEAFLHQQQSIPDSKTSSSVSVITPWFQILKDKKLMRWWKTLIESGTFPNESHHIEKFS